MWKKINPVNGEYKIFLINDIHIRAGVDGNSTATGATNGADRFYYAVPNNLRNFIKKANDEKPDLIVVLGDMCDIPSDYSLFNEIWSGLDDTIPRVLTIGNHDLDVQNFPELMDLLRYKGKKEVGGSKFNQSFSLTNKGFNTKFIMLDTTFNAHDLHGSHWQNVRAHTSSVDWLKNELEKSDANQIFICTHVAPHLVDIELFDPIQKEQIKNMIDNVLIAKPNLKINWLFGHHHVTNREVFTNLGEKNTGHLLPAMILWETGRFTELRVKNDTFILAKRDLPYSLS